MQPGNYATNPIMGGIGMGMPGGMGMNPYMTNMAGMGMGGMGGNMGGMGGMGAMGGMGGMGMGSNPFGNIGGNSQFATNIPPPSSSFGMNMGKPSNGFDFDIMKGHEKKKTEDNPLFKELFEQVDTKIKDRKQDLNGRKFEYNPDGEFSSM